MQHGRLQAAVIEQIVWSFVYIGWSNQLIKWFKCDWWDLGLVSIVSVLVWRIKVLVSGNFLRPTRNAEDFY